jgi:hypothetical protein
MASPAPSASIAVMRALSLGLLGFVVPLLPGQAGPDLRERIETLRADLGDLAPPLTTCRCRANAAAASWPAGNRSAASSTPSTSTALGQDARIDWLLLDNHVRRSTLELQLEAGRDAELAELLPFAASIVELAERRRRLEDVTPRAPRPPSARSRGAPSRCAQDLTQGRITNCRRRCRRAPRPAWRAAAERCGSGSSSATATTRSSAGGCAPLQRAADEALDRTLRRPARDGPRGDDRSLVGDPIGEQGCCANWPSSGSPTRPASSSRSPSGSSPGATPRWPRRRRRWAAPTGAKHSRRSSSTTARRASNRS